MAFVEATGAGNSSSATPTLAYPTNVAAGDTLVAGFCNDFGAADTAPTDTLGNSYARARAALTDANFYNHTTWVAYSPTGGANTVTGHLPGPPTSGSLQIGRFSGRASVSVVSATAVNEQATPGTGAGGVTCGPVTAAAGDDAWLYLADVGGITQNTFSAAGSFTERGEWGGTGVDIDMAMHTQNNLGAGSFTATATQATNERTVSILILLKAASGGGTALASVARGGTGRAQGLLTVGSPTLGPTDYTRFPKPLIALRARGIQ